MGQFPSTSRLPRRIGVADKSGLKNLEFVNKNKPENKYDVSKHNLRVSKNKIRGMGLFFFEECHDSRLEPSFPITSPRRGPKRMQPKSKLQKPILVLKGMTKQSIVLRVLNA